MEVWELLSQRSVQKKAAGEGVTIQNFVAGDVCTCKVC